MAAEIPKEQTVIALDQFGDSSVLQPRKAPVVEPGEGEVLVRIEATSVNPADYKLRAGYWKAYPHEFPIVLGWDLSGTVVKNGHAARRFQPGEAVWAYSRRPKIGLNHGSYAQYITLPEAYLSPRPKSLSAEQAAAVPLAGLTAYEGLKVHGEFKEGQSVLILGASGGVGLIAVQLAAKAFGGKHVIGVASSKNHELLKKHGATGTIDYKGDIKAELEKLVPGGVDLVYDCFGGEGLKLAEQYVKPSGGIIVSIAGQATSSNPKIAAKGFLVEPNTPRLQHLGELLDKGQLSVVVDKVVPLEKVAQVHDELAQGHTTGKIVLKISH